MTLAEALVSSENCSTPEEAKAEIREMAERVNDGEDPEEVLLDYGLESEYIFDILEHCM
jgi:hypothetical protein